MKAEWVYRLTAEADVLREKWHHGVESERVGKESLIARVEIRSRDGGGIEYEVHMR